LTAVDAIRFEADALLPAGFAYDRVSGRFLLGRVGERKIEVVNERSARLADLVRADSAGFRDLAAIEIDALRGDLWVISNDPGDGGATLHKLQLVAGRPLGAFRPPPGADRAQLVDLAVTPGGAVLIVDAGGGRLLRAAPRSAALELLMPLDRPGLTAITATDGDALCFVAHDHGILRVDMNRRIATPLQSPDGLSLDGVTGLWWHAGALVTLQTSPSGERQLRRLQLDQRGAAIAAVKPIDAVLPAGDQPFAATVSGDELYFVEADPRPARAANGQQPAVVRRVRLR
jgi:hypothetical protein